MPKVTCPVRDCEHNDNQVCRAVKVALNRELGFVDGKRMTVLKCSAYTMREVYRDLLRMGCNIRGTRQKEEMYNG